MANSAKNANAINSLNRYKNGKQGADDQPYTISNENQTLATPQNIDYRSDNGRYVMMGDHGCSDIGMMDQSCSFDASMLNDVRS